MGRSVLRIYCVFCVFLIGLLRGLLSIGTVSIELG